MILRFFTSIFLLSSHWVRKFFYQSNCCFSKAISVIDVTLSMAQPIMVLPAIVRQAKKRATKRVKWGNKEDIRVSLVFNRAKSWQVVGDPSPWRKEYQEACIWWFDHLQFDLAKNWIALYFDQVSYWPKSLLSTHTFGFSFLVLSLGWKVFLSTISIIFRFSSHISSSSSGGFLLFDSLVWFFSPVSIIWLGRFFTNDMILIQTHQLPYGARIFSLVFRFSSSVPNRLGGFLSTPEARFSSLPSFYRKKVFPTACRSSCSFKRLPLELSFYLSSHVFQSIILTTTYSAELTY